MKELVNACFADKLVELKEEDVSWTDDHPADGGHRENNFEEKGFIIWSSYRKRNPLTGQTVVKGDVYDGTELALFENGQFALLGRTPVKESFRSSFESLSYFSGYRVTRIFLTADELGAYGEALADELLPTVRDRIPPDTVARLRSAMGAD
jgi:hypothetical protein